MIMFVFLQVKITLQGLFIQRFLLQLLQVPLSVPI